jgi:hypothetical protein
MWCVPELDDEYIERMEDVLALFAGPLNPREPVIALDERPVQLLDAARPGRRAAPGKVTHRIHLIMDNLNAHCRKSAPAPFTEVALVFSANAELNEHKYQRAVKLAVEKYCSVGATLDPSVAITWQARLVPAVESVG